MFFHHRTAQERMIQPDSSRDHTPEIREILERKTKYNVLPEAEPFMGRGGPRPTRKN